jgi:glycosyltransferase involved in cell wall biosynthesis
MRICVISFKECWTDESGRWFSSGGFPAQMTAIGGLFEEMTLVIVRGPARKGGIGLPAEARVVPMRKPSGRGARRKLSVLVRLREYLLVMLPHIRRADVVHVPLPGDLPVVGLLASLALRKRILARFGGSWYSTTETTLMDRLTRSCMRWFAGGRNLMLATGLGPGRPAKDIDWIPVSAISRDEVARIQPDPERPVHTPLHLAYVGRLSPEKGVADLVEALALLRSNARSPGLLPTLVVIGDGPQRGALLRLAERRGCADLVEFAGQLNRSELLQRLLDTDVCVLPSLSESFCKARLDAMLCGVPVITTPVGFGREIVAEDGERGWIVPAHDPSHLAERLDLLGKGVDWPAVRRRCRAFAERWTVEDWALSIGQRCARRWNLALVGGKLCA